MAASLKIKSGSKMAMALDVPAGQHPDFCMICTFSTELSESSFLVSIPMKDGKPLQVDETQKLLIRYDQGKTPMFLAGYVDEVVKQGLRRYWKIRRVSENRNFYQRTDERIQITLHVEYRQPTWRPNEDGVIETEEGLTLDISAGGLAMYLNHVFAVGEVCEVTLPTIGTTRAGKSITLIGENCWNRRAEKGSIFRNVCGLKFRYKDERDKKRVTDYINVAKKYTA